MSTIYLILGITGWTAAAIVLPLYLFKGMNKKPCGVENDVAAAERKD